jgi:hypothetical protein
MTTVLHMCPQCGCPDVQVSGRGLVDAEGNSVSTAKCPNCGWAGAGADTVGAVTTEKLWTSERIAEHFLKTATNKLMPLILEDLFFLGLLPRAIKLPEDAPPEQVVEATIHNRQVGESAGIILSKITPVLLQAIFEAAAEEAQKFTYDPHVKKTMRGLEDEMRDRVFGGDDGEEEG